MVGELEEVRGLNRFRERFAGLEECYVLIGGTASLLAMREADLAFRGRKDLDIVLCVEALEDRFYEVFWEFIRDGGYNQQGLTSGVRKYYRFSVGSGQPEEVLAILRVAYGVPES